MTETNEAATEFLMPFLRKPWVQVFVFVVAVLTGAEALKGAVENISGYEIPTVSFFLDKWSKDWEADEFTEEADRLYFETSEGVNSAPLYEKATNLGDPYAKAMMANNGSIDCKIRRTISHLQMNS